jgi:ice-binding like protein
MHAEPDRSGSKFASVLVVVALLIAAFVVMIPWAGASPSRGSSPAIVTPGQARAGAACGQVPVPLGSASTYAALSGTTVTSTGATALTGDLGVSPGSAVTGFPPGTYTGVKNVANAASAGAALNATTAFNNASGRSNCAVTVAGNIGGQTLTPGLYKSTSSLAISSGDLTLSGGGNPNGVFVFQVASAITTTSGRAVILSGGAQAGNVFWEAGSSITLGTTSKMSGTLIAYASITMNTGSHLDGRALARTGDVTLSASTIVVPTTTSSATYAVTFTENGLTSNTPWSMSLAGVPASSSSNTIVFQVGDGSYTYVIDSVSGFRATPSSGSVTVSGGSASQLIAFAAGTSGTYPLTFTSSGLVSGTSWTVTVNGVLKTSTTGTVQFREANGTYGYTIGGATDYTAIPAAGRVAVIGSDVTQVIVFASLNGVQAYTVTFTETGLAAGTNWSVTLKGVAQPSASSTLVFTELNGTNAFTVGASSGYAVSPSSGNLTTHGAAASQALTFTPSGGGGSSGTPTWEWALLGLIIVGAIVAVAAAVMMSRRRK